MLLKVARIHNTAKLPSRANPSDAGADVFYCPKHDPDNFRHVRIDPGDSVVLPTGLKVEVPHGYMLEVKNRSGMAAKKNLVVGACVVDSGYSGEIFVNLHNIGKTKKIVEVGDKIAQLVMIPVVNFRATQSTSGDLYRNPITISDRGDGALGSTDE